jgi:hypothetical protein
LQDENFRKRKLPVVSSVVKVKKFNHDGEEEEGDDDYGSRQAACLAVCQCQQNLKGKLLFHLLNKLTRI